MVKDWQTDPVEVREGDRIKLNAQGTWTLDRQNKSAADVYQYVCKTTGGEPLAAGGSAEFTAATSGKLLLRIVSLLPE